MARPTKKGLDYFPLDVDFLSDLKVRRIIKACGKEAVHILVALLANIYRDEGYYVLWDDDLAFLVADEVGTKEGTVEELNLVDIYGDELVNAAIKLAGSKDVPKNRAISFLTASLQEWADANVKTIEQAREYQRTRGAKKQSYNQKPIREEQLPDRAENPVEEPQISPERQAEIDAKLAAYLSEKNQRKELD